MGNYSCVKVKMSAYLDVWLCAEGIYLRQLDRVGWWYIKQTNAMDIKPMKKILRVWSEIGYNEDNELKR